jgi:hypothetical protein
MMGEARLSAPGGDAVEDPVRSVVVFSQCLGFAACRYDGDVVIEPAVEALKRHVEARPICPELEIGLRTQGTHATTSSRASGPVLLVRLGTAASRIERRTRRGGLFESEE